MKEKIIEIVGSAMFMIGLIGLVAIASVSDQIDTTIIESRRSE